MPRVAGRYQVQTVLFALARCLRRRYRRLGGQSIRFPYYHIDIQLPFSGRKPLVVYTC